MRPTRLAERLQLSPDVVAEEARDLVDGLGCKCAVPGILQFTCEPATENAFDAGLAERTDVIAANGGAHRGAAQTAFFREGLGALYLERHLRADAERQTGRGIAPGAQG